MKFQFKWCLWALTLGACSLLAAPALRAKDREHVVWTKDSQKDVQKAAQTRQGNEAAVRELFRSDAAQNTLKSAHVDYQKVDKAVGQLSDEELAKLAERSRQIEKDFAAGNMSGRGPLLLFLFGGPIVLLVGGVRWVFFLRRRGGTKMKTSLFLTLPVGLS